MAANAAAPSGFQTCRRYDGAPPNGATREMNILYSYATKIAYGDPVYLASDGTIRLYAAGGTTIHGIFRGCRYLDPTAQRTVFQPAWLAPTLASTTVVTAIVDMDPNLTFQCQAVGTALTQAAIGLNMDITAASSGQPNLAGLSVCSLSGTAAATATLPFRIVGIVPSPSINANYNSSNDNQWLEVMMNTADVPTGTRTGQA